MVHRQIRATIESMTSEHDAQTAEAIRRVDQACAFMHARTVAFWGHHDKHTRGEPRQYGSGVLLQIDDKRFIATAEHVCDLFLRQGCSAFIGGGADKLIHLDRSSVRYTKHHDVALLALRENVWSKISSEKEFVRLSEVDSGDPTYDAGGIYCAFGYPFAASNTDHGSKQHSMVAEHCWGRPYGKEMRPTREFAYDPNAHIAIEFDSSAHSNPNGMSGGGIWRIRQGGVPAGGWSTKDIKLVAIEHTVGIDHVALVGTRVRYLFLLARSLDSSLAPALDLIWPGKRPILPERIVRDA
jgi:hypothetical protein